MTRFHTSVSARPARRGRCRRRTFAAAVFVTALTCLPIVSARAEPPDDGGTHGRAVVVGRALLEDGQKLAAQGRLADAAEALKQSVAADPSPEALLALAGCDERLGRTASAWGELLRAADRAAALGDTARAEEARRRAAALEPRVTRLKVVLRPSSPELTVLVDDRTIDNSEVGVALPVNLGVHRVSARAPGMESWTTTLRLDHEGESKEVIVPPLRALPERDKPGPWARSTAPAASSGPTTKEYVFLTLVCVGIAGGGFGGAFVAEADRHQEFVAPAVITLSASAAILVVALVVAWSNAQDQKHRVVSTRGSMDIRLEPSVGAAGAGLTLRGAF